jgi:hypothetical protein
MCIIRDNELESIDRVTEAVRYFDDERVEFLDHLGSRESRSLWFGGAN